MKRMNTMINNRLMEYWESPALSQSFLKKVLANDTSVEKTDSIYMSRGSYVDDLLSFGEEYIKEMYYIMDGEYPTPMWKNTIDSIYNVNKDITLKDVDIWLPVFREINKSKLLDINVIDGMTNNWYYREALEEAGNRRIITRQEATLGDFAVHNFRKHPYVKHIFDIPGEHQVPLYWEYTAGNTHDESDIIPTTVQCKGLLDRLNIDEYNKTAQIIDFKLTSEPLYQWPRGLCRKFNVPFQLSYYHYGLQQNITNLGLEGYSLLLPAVVIESMDYPGKPRIYQLTFQDIIQGSHGYERIASEVVTDGEIHQPEVYRKYGWMDGVYRYCKSKQMGLEDYDIEYHTNKGVFELNSFT